jgi:hypothetical protein
LSAAAFVMLVSADAMCDGGVDAGKDGSTDSGIGTKPSPNNPTVSPDSGATSTGDAGAGEGGGDDSGCSFTAQRSDGWSPMLGLVAAGSMLVMSRRRRNKR